MSEPSAVDWRFLQHPAFGVSEDVVRERLASFLALPEPSQLLELARGIPNAVEPWFEFVPQDDAEVAAAGGYDRAIAQRASIPTRSGSYHDLLGALIWLHFPACKTAIHRAQLAAPPGARGPRENAATLFDESGVLVLSRDLAVFELLSTLRWVELFWTRRASLLHSTRFLCFGHGLLDALRAPHPRLMGKALFVHVGAEQWALPRSELRVLIDRVLAARLPTFLEGPALLAPLPVLGVPGWATSQDLEFYSDARYFQTERRRTRATAAPAWLALSP